MTAAKRDELVFWTIRLGTLAVLAIPLIAWGDRLQWQLNEVDALSFFPLLGLLAFSLMWWHFAVGSMKRLWPDAFPYKRFYRLTGNLVFALIVAHPAIIFYRSSQLEFTVYDYVGPNNGLYITFGILALFVFLLYEVADRLKERSNALILRYWPLIKAFNVAAFVAIYFHGLMLGTDLQHGWLRGVWLFYGVTAAIFIIHGYWYDLKKQPHEQT